MNIVELAKQAGLHVANDSEGHFSGVTNEEIIDLHPDPNKERDRLFREKIFIEVLTPFAALVAAHEREACAYRAGIALLGADRGLANRVEQAIRVRGTT